MSLGSILSIARTAITTHQLAVEVTSHNISNAQTEGYSRQQARLQPGVPLRSTLGSIGTGVQVVDVNRVRDGLLDANYRREAGTAAGFEARQELLGRVEQIFAEPSDTGLAATLDAFWSAWGDLASEPTSTGARGVVQQRGAQVAFVINNFANQLGDQGGFLGLRLENSLRELNGLASEVAELNDRILAMEAGGKESPDLRDSRDRAIDAMTRIVPVRVIDRANGTSAVLVGNLTLVDGVDANTLELKNASGNPLQSGDLKIGNRIGLGLQGSQGAFPQVSGALGAMLDLFNNELPEVQASLDTLATELAAKVNGVHNPGGSGVDFYQITAGGELALSDAVAASVSQIAAGTAGPGDNGIALALASFRDAPLVDADGDGTGDKSFGAFYRDVVTSVALKTSSAQSSAEAYGSLAAQAETRRSSVSGVSVDEELIKLMTHQQAYVAASKLVNVADEMAQTILNMV